MVLPDALNKYAQARVSVRRIEQFLAKDEVSGSSSNNSRGSGSGGGGGGGSSSSDGGGGGGEEEEEKMRSKGVNEKDRTIFWRTMR